MEVYAASRRDLANAIQSYNDNDSITCISGAKVQQNSEIPVHSSSYFILWKLFLLSPIEVDFIFFMGIANSHNV